jgi:hypothetical protein
MSKFLKGLCVRVGAGLGATVILLIAVTVGALLGNDPDEMLAWSMIAVSLLSTGAVVVIFQFEEKINSLS